MSARGLVLDFTIWALNRLPRPWPSDMEIYEIDGVFLGMMRSELEGLHGKCEGLQVSQTLTRMEYPDRQLSILLEGNLVKSVSGPCLERKTVGNRSLGKFSIGQSIFSLAFNLFTIPRVNRKTTFTSSGARFQVYAWRISKILEASLFIESLSFRGFCLQRTLQPEEQRRHLLGLGGP